jgi:hypothetical protein
MENDLNSDQSINSCLILMKLLSQDQSGFIDNLIFTVEISKIKRILKFIILRFL